MGFMLTRRYIIDAATEEELIRLANERRERFFDDPNYEDSEITSPVEAASTLASLSEVGDATDVTLTLDEWVESEGSKTDMYFESRREARRRLLETMNNPNNQ